MVRLIRALVVVAFAFAVASSCHAQQWLGGLVDPSTTPSTQQGTIHVTVYLAAIYDDGTISAFNPEGHATLDLQNNRVYHPNSIHQPWIPHLEAITQNTIGWIVALGSGLVSGGDPRPIDTHMVNWPYHRVTSVGVPLYAFARNDDGQPYFVTIFPKLQVHW